MKVQLKGQVTTTPEPEVVEPFNWTPVYAAIGVILGGGACAGYCYILNRRRGPKKGAKGGAKKKASVAPVTSPSPKKSLAAEEALETVAPVGEKGMTPGKKITKPSESAKGLLDDLLSSSRGFEEGKPETPATAEGTLAEEGKDEPTAGPARGHTPGDLDVGRPAPREEPAGEPAPAAADADAGADADAAAAEASAVKDGTAE